MDDLEVVRRAVELMRGSGTGAWRVIAEALGDELAREESFRTDWPTADAPASGDAFVLAGAVARAYLSEVG